MKKFIPAFAAVLPVLFLFNPVLAQGQNIIKMRAQEIRIDLKEDMRVFVKDGEEVITRFPSKYLENRARLSVYLPEGYADAQGRFPSFYILEHEGGPQYARADFADNPNMAGAVVIVVSMSGGGDAGAFLARELLPYIDLNYKTDDTAQARTLLGADDMGLKIIGMLASGAGASFKKAFVALYAATAVPQLGDGFTPDIKIAAAGALGNMARLQQLLEDKNLKFARNFVTAGAPCPPTEKCEIKPWAAYDYSWLNAPAAAIAGITPRLGAGKISLAAGSALLWLDVKFKGGFAASYIPADLKFSPPFLAWDPAAAELSIIPGATAGKVKISGPLYFYGKGFKTSLKLTE
ncbi:MAG: esterase family protein [Elusimicrobiota bacterium]|jgi:hypothetical protein|nr:esterase family protein [Elusimicrobiota bacterium]